MTAFPEQIRAHDELISPHFSLEDFVGRKWLLDTITTFREDKKRRHFIIVGEPGIGKSTFLAFLAKKWNCPIHFLRTDSIGGATGLDTRAFLVSIAFQLFQKFGSSIFQQTFPGDTRVSVSCADGQSEVVGRFIEQLHSPLPFLKTPTRSVEVVVGQATGHSRITGERIGNLVNTVYELDEKTLLHITILAPLEKILEFYPDETVVICIDALDEAVQHGKQVFFDIIPKATDALYPSNLKLVLTSRHGSHLSQFIQKDIFLLDSEVEGNNKNNHDDVVSFVEAQLSTPQFRELCNKKTAKDIQELIDKIVQRSDGNFLYLKHYFRELRIQVINGKQDLSDISVPQGLDEIYRAFAIHRIRQRSFDTLEVSIEPAPTSALLERVSMTDGVRQVFHEDQKLLVAVDDMSQMVQKLYGGLLPYPFKIKHLELHQGSSWNEWQNTCLPILGILAVALDSITIDQLALMSRVDRQKAAVAIQSIEEYLEVDQCGGKYNYRVYHRSFADYLLDSKRNVDIPIDNKQQHQHIVSCCFEILTKQGPKELITTLGQYPAMYLRRHILASESHTKLLKLISPDWMELQYSSFGTYQYFSDDLAEAFNYAAENQEQGICEVVKSSIASVSLQRITADTPLSFIVALVACGHATRAMSLAATTAEPAKRAMIYCRIARFLDDDLRTSAITGAKTAVALVTEKHKRSEISKDLALLLLINSEFDAAMQFLGDAVKNSDFKKALPITKIFEEFIDRKDSSLAKDLAERVAILLKTIPLDIDSWGRDNSFVTEALVAITVALPSDVRSTWLVETAGEIASIGNEPCLIVRIIETLCKKKLVDVALDLANTAIEDKLAINAWSALCDVAFSSGNENAMQKARTALLELNSRNNSLPDHLSSQLASSLLRVGEEKLAIERSLQITQAIYKSTFYEDFTAYLIQQRCWNKIEEMLPELKMSDQVKILTECANVMSNADQHKEALHFVNRAHELSRSLTFKTKEIAYEKLIESYLLLGEWGHIDAIANEVLSWDILLKICEYIADHSLLCDERTASIVALARLIEPKISDITYHSGDEEYEITYEHMYKAEARAKIARALFIVGAVNSANRIAKEALLETASMVFTNHRETTIASLVNMLAEFVVFDDTFAGGWSEDDRAFNLCLIAKALSEYGYHENAFQCISSELASDRTRGEEAAKVALSLATANYHDESLELIERCMFKPEVSNQDYIWLVLKIAEMQLLAGEDGQSAVNYARKLAGLNDNSFIFLAELAVRFKRLGFEEDAENLAERAITEAEKASDESLRNADQGDTTYSFFKVALILAAGGVSSKAKKAAKKHSWARDKVCILVDELLDSNDLSCLSIDDNYLDRFRDGEVRTPHSTDVEDQVILLSSPGKWQDAFCATNELPEGDYREQVLWSLSFRAAEQTKFDDLMWPLADDCESELITDGIRRAAVALKYVVQNYIPPLVKAKSYELMNSASGAGNWEHMVRLAVAYAQKSKFDDATSAINNLGVYSSVHSLKGILKGYVAEQMARQGQFDNALELVLSSEYSPFYSCSDCYCWYRAEACSQVFTEIAKQAGKSEALGKLFTYLRKKRNVESGIVFELIGSAVTILALNGAKSRLNDLLRAVQNVQGWWCERLSGAYSEKE